ncbi:hypothetical protein [Aneurinibacillus terranovensis]|nr:hypothetical protein [Aneurinibacillus terranovensis]
MDRRRSTFLRLAKGGRHSMVLRARSIDRPQRPGAPQIVAPLWKHGG